MKPYRIGHYWVDLDHVLWVSDDVIFDPYRSWWVVGTLQLAFQNELWEPRLGEMKSRKYHPDDGTKCNLMWTFDQAELDAYKAMWAEFKTAWKTKDTMFASTKP